MLAAAAAVAEQPGGKRRPDSEDHGTSSSNPDAKRKCGVSLASTPVSPSRLFDTSGQFMLTDCAETRASYPHLYDARGIFQLSVPRTIQYLAIKNAHPRDVRVAHSQDTPAAAAAPSPVKGQTLYRYFVDGKAVGVSVTEFIAQFQSKFSPIPQATRMVARDDFWDRYETYRAIPGLQEALAAKNTGQAISIITASWSEKGRVARDRGTFVHGILERQVNARALVVVVCFLSNDTNDLYGQISDPRVVDDGSTAVMRAVPQPYTIRSCATELGQSLRWHWRRRLAGFVDFRTEWKVYTGPEYDMAGCIDLVQICPSTGILHLVDYKISDKILDPAFGGRMAFGLMADWPANKHTSAAMQLGIYRFILEQYYGFRVGSLLVVCFHEDLPDSLEIPIDISRDLIARVMQSRAHALRAIIVSGGSSSSGKGDRLSHSQTKQRW